jgi:hypothetical protein
MELHHMHAQADDELVVSQGNVYSTKKKHMLGARASRHSTVTATTTPM